MPKSPLLSASSTMPMAGRAREREERLRPGVKRYQPLGALKGRGSGILAVEAEAVKKPVFHGGVLLMCTE